MNTRPTPYNPPVLPGPAARRPRRPGVFRRAALAATVLAGAATLMLTATGSAFAAGLDQTSPQWAEIGPWGYTGDQSSQVTAVYTIQNVAEPGTEMLEDHGNSMDDGGVADVWTRLDQSTNQDPVHAGPYGPITQANYLWEFVPHTPADGGSIVQNWGELINRQSGLCLDVANNNTGDAAAMDQWTCNGGSNQQWAAEPVNGHYYLIPLLDMGTPNSVLGVGNGGTCATSGDGDSVYVRTTGTIGNPCDEWNIQQASYDFATHPLDVPDAQDFITDNRSYECVPGDSVRATGTAGSPWDYRNLGNSTAEVYDGLSYTSYVPGGSFEYSSKDNPLDETGQVMLYCDPSTQAP